jgi:hypothetical protein
MDEFLRLKTREAFAHLAGIWSSPPAADSKLTPEDAESATQAVDNLDVDSLDVDSLEGLELVYYYCKSLCKDKNLIGDPKSVFAVFSEDDGTLQVFTKAERFYSIHEFPWVKVLNGALEGGIGEGAIFHRCDGEATCVSNGFTARGATYAEAAMRAWLKEWINTR